MKINNKMIKLDLSLSFITFLIFLILKLTEVIDWSWWFITAPLWVGLAIILVALVILVAISLIVTTIVLLIVGIRTLFDF